MLVIGLKGLFLTNIAQIQRRSYLCQ